MATITKMEKPRNDLRDYNSFSQTDASKVGHQYGKFFCFNQGFICNM